MKKSLLILQFLKYILSLDIYFFYYISIQRKAVHSERPCSVFSNFHAFLWQHFKKIIRQSVQRDPLFLSECCICFETNNTQATFPRPPALHLGLMSHFPGLEIFLLPQKSFPTKISFISFSFWLFLVFFFCIFQLHIIKIWDGQQTSLRHLE